MVSMFVIQAHVQPLALMSRMCLYESVRVIIEYVLY